MKKVARVICLILAMLMMAVLCVSCADTGDSNTTTTGPSTTKPPNQGESTLKPKVPDGLKFDGQEIHIIFQASDWFDDEIYVEVESGEAIPDAIWLRNDLVQKQLGVTIVPYAQTGSGEGPATKVLTEVEKDINANTGIYSAMVSSSYKAAPKSMEKFFVDLTDMSEYFDLTQPYWSQGINDAISIGDAQYLCTGAMLLSSYRLIYGTLFNEDLFIDHSVELPYDLVDQKKWTIEYQKSIVEIFYDGTDSTDTSATYGFIVNNELIGCDPYWSSLKVPLIVKDENNMFKISIDRERTVQAVTAICDLIYNTQGTLAFESYGNDSEQEDLARKFSEGTAAMVHLRLMELEGEYLRQMEDIFGIVPMPMLNSEQGGYYTTAHDQISVVGVPNTRKEAAELEMIGAFLDLMGYYSATEVTPQYYEVCLKGRYYENQTAQNMLDILTKGLYIDPAFIYSEALGSPVASWRGWVAANKTYVTSAVTVLEKSMRSHIDSINNAFKKLAK